MVIFAAQEIRQHGAVAPRRRRGRGPLVVVTGMAARVAHGVDGAAAAEYLAARPVEPPAAELGLTLGAIAPVDATVAGKECDARRHVDHRVAVCATGLDEEHTQLLAGRE